MKHIAKILSAAIALVVAVPAAAVTETKTEQPAKSEGAKPFTTSETTIGDLLADPAAKAIVDKHLPGLSEHPSISMASAMTLRAIQPMAGDMIPVEKLDAIDADLAKLPAK